MKKLIAALFAAMLATPAMACTDWKTIAAFDAVLAAHAHDDTKGAAPSDDVYRLLNELEKDKAAALADTSRGAPGAMANTAYIRSRFMSSAWSWFAATNPNFTLLRAGERRRRHSARAAAGGHQGAFSSPLQGKAPVNGLLPGCLLTAPTESAWVKGEVNVGSTIITH